MQASSILFIRTVHTVNIIRYFLPAIGENSVKPLAMNIVNVMNIFHLPLMCLFSHMIIDIQLQPAIEITAGWSEETSV